MYKILYCLIGMYILILGWFIYVGPYSSLVTCQQLAQTKQRVVVSMTTTPYRINMIKQTLDSIIDQSLKPDKIYVHIPKYFVRGELVYKIPNWLLEYPNVEIIRGRDYGPITKLLPTLYLEQDNNTIIITLDDDIWYPRHVIRDLINATMSKPNCVHTPVNMRFSLDTNGEISDIQYKYRHASVAKLVLGSAGVAYRRGFFTDDFFSFVDSIPKVCLLADDLMVSMYLHSKRIDILQAADRSLHPLVTPFTYKKQDYHQAVGALSYVKSGKSGNHTNYAACIAELQQTDYAYVLNFMLE